MRKILSTPGTARFTFTPPGRAGIDYTLICDELGTSVTGILNVHSTAPKNQCGVRNVDPAGNDSCVAQPDTVSGALTIDPDILLTAKKYNLQLNFYYATDQTDNAEFGANRSCSTRARIYSDTMSSYATVVAGDFGVQAFMASGGGYVNAGTTNNDTTLTFDSGTDTFTQWFNDGKKVQYQPQTGTTGPVVTHQMVSVTDASGVGMGFHYPTSSSDPNYGLLTTITLEGPNTVLLGYYGSAGSRLLSYVQDFATPTARQWKFQYDDTTRNMTTMISALGCATGYGYTHLLSGQTVLNSITDSRGYTTNYQFDSNARVVGIQAGDAVWLWNYNDNADGTPRQNIMVSPGNARTTFNISDSMISTIDRPEGYTSEYQYDPDSSIMVQETRSGLGVVYSIMMDSLWRITTMTDVLGGQTLQKYDIYGNMTTYIDANGAISTFGFDGAGSTMQCIRYTDPLGRVTSFMNNSDGQVVSVIDGRGLMTQYGYDSYGNRISMTASDGGFTQWGYDSLNRLVSMTDPINRKSTQAWDAGDNMIGRTHPTGASWQYFYDKCLLQATVSPLGFRTTNSYGRFSTPVSIIDANNHITTTTPDSMGYPIAYTDALGNIATTVLDPMKRPIQRIDQLNYSSYVQYDNFGRATTTIDANGNVSKTVYNARYEVVSVIDGEQNMTQYYYDNVGRRTTTVNALGQVNATVYDLAGQAGTLINGLNQQTYMYYDPAGNLTTTVDVNNVTTVNVMAANSNRVTATIDGNGNRVSFTRDLAGQLLAIQNARGYRWSMTLDGVGRQVSLVNQLGEMTQWYYDADGRNTTQVDANSRVKTQTFDPVSNLVSILWADGSRCSMFYDPADRPTTIIDSTGVTSLVWSARGQLAVQEDPTGFFWGLEYDGVGNRVNQEFSGGASAYLTNWGYDSANRLVSILNGANELTLITPDPLGREIKRVQANGWVVNQVFDAAGNQTFRTTFDSVGNVIAAYGATYDNVGNRKQIFWGDGTRQQFSYDYAYQLVTEQCAGTFNYEIQYVYDGAGNRISMLDSSGTTNYSYTSADELVLITPPTGPATVQAFDHNGNLTTVTTGSDVTVNVWDYENRLIQQTLPDGTVITNTFSCDGKRRSVAGSGPSAPTPLTFTWDGDNIFRVDLNGGAEFVYLTNYPGYWGGLASSRGMAGASAGSGYFAFDMQGNAVVQTQIGGGPLQQQAYTVFGQQLLPFNGAGFQFGAQWGYFTDLATLIMLTDTPYDTMTGRRLRRDPLGFAGGTWNLFPLVGSNPVNVFDPSGLQSQCFISAYLSLASIGIDLATACAQANDVCHDDYPCNPPPPPGTIRPIIIPTGPSHRRPIRPYPFVPFPFPYQLFGWVTCDALQRAACDQKCINKNKSLRCLDCLVNVDENGEAVDYDCTCTDNSSCGL